MEYCSLTGTQQQLYTGVVERARRDLGDHGGRDVCVGGGGHGGVCECFVSIDSVCSYLTKTNFSIAFYKSFLQRTPVVLKGLMEEGTR